MTAKKTAPPAAKKSRVATPRAAPVAAKAAPAARRTAAATPPPPVASKAAKAPANTKPKPVRDSFTMPAGDFAVIATLKARALEGRRAAKKSELLRAGLHALDALDAKALVAALDRLDPVKTGRPKKGR